jgi:hypothetical protein
MIKFKTRFNKIVSPEIYIKCITKFIEVAEDDPNFDRQRLENASNEELKVSYPRGTNLYLLKVLESNLREVRIHPLPIDYINFKADLIEYMTQLLES